MKYMGHKAIQGSRVCYTLSSFLLDPGALANVRSLIPHVYTKHVRDHGTPSENEPKTTPQGASSAREHRMRVFFFLKYVRISITVGILRTHF